MLLAHGGSAGASVELLILGLAMAVLGVVFFVQKTTKSIVPLLLVVGGIGLGVAGFVSARGAADGHDDERAAAAVVDYQETVDALCEERAGVAANGEASGAAFLDRAHAGIHEIASRTEGEDRAAAARLLEAKGAFESDLRDGDVKQRDVERDLNELIAAMVAALSVLDEEVEPCS